jgi:hypothetical protein
VASHAEDWSLQGINVGKVTHSGTQVKLHGLVLTHIAYLKIPTLHLQLACQRCKTLFDLPVDSSLQYERQTSCVCTTCSNAMSINYRGELVHVSNSRLGYVDCIQCTLVDVLASDMYLHCEECGCELKKHDRPVFVSTLCRQCHTKLSLTSTIKWYQVAASKAPIVIPARQKKKKDILGLQGNGTCEHYKKSKRFFRFPCCGKCFPCDTCHDLKSDHSAEWATRMICGFCRMEQNTSDTCRSCHEDVVGNQKSRFWEGGKGTRNRTAMSRNDKRKYRGLSKTVSNRRKE